MTIMKNGQIQMGIINLDTPLSSRASETTVSLIKSYISSLSYDVNGLLISLNADNIGLAKTTDVIANQPRYITNAYNSTDDRFKITVESTVNPPNLDTQLSILYNKLVSQDNSLTSINTKVPLFEESFTFPTITTTGASAVWSMTNCFKDFTIVLKNNSTGTAPLINIEGSIDNTNWFVLESSNINGIDAIHLINAPIKYMRINIISLNDATTINCNVIGVR